MLTGNKSSSAHIMPFSKLLAEREDAKLTTYCQSLTKQGWIGCSCKQMLFILYTELFFFFCTCIRNTLASLLIMQTIYDYEILAPASHGNSFETNSSRPEPTGRFGQTSKLKSEQSSYCAKLGRASFPSELAQKTLACSCVCSCEYFIFRDHNTTE